MSTVSVDVVIKNTAVTIGEGPHWDDQSQCLLYVDIFNGDVHRWNSVTGEDDKIHLVMLLLNCFKLVLKLGSELQCVTAIGIMGSAVQNCLQSLELNDGTLSFVVPCSKGGYLVSVNRDICHLDWDSKKTITLHSVDPGTQNRFNDAKCDRQGRLWAGTMGLEFPSLEREKGSLYRLNQQGELDRCLDKINISNGLAWSGDSSMMYFVDSFPKKVYAFDFDAESGNISNQREAFTVENGFPDGMAMDTEGKLWIACFDVGRVVRYDPVTGKELRVVEIPVKKTTSCCFGGKGLDELYVTTCAKHSDGDILEDVLEKEPLAGSVFRVTGLGVRGYPASVYKG